MCEAMERRQQKFQTNPHGILFKPICKSVAIIPSNRCKKLFVLKFEKSNVRIKSDDFLSGWLRRNRPFQ
jgi:hypothetical protein